MEILALSATSLLLIATLYLLTLIKPWLGKKKSDYPPIAGTIFDQLLNFHRLHDFLTDISGRYKTFRLLAPFGFGKYVFTVDPVNVEYILRTNFSNYGKGEFLYDLANDFLGDGIFSVDGDKWRHQRKVASYEFSAKVLRDYTVVVFKRNATKLAEIVLDSARTDQMIEMQDLFMKSTLDSIFKVGFGVELDTLSGSNEEGMIFAKAFDDSSAQLVLRLVDVFWKMKKFLNIGLEGKMKKDIKFIDEFVYKLIDTKIEDMSRQQNDSVRKEDILSRFLIEREKDPENISLKYLRDIVLSFVIAGRDTTAGTLSWFFYMMCKHPNVQENVAQEVKQVTSRNETIQMEEFAETLTEEALNRMPYLHAALSETLRLYPAVPLGVKCCFSDDTLPDGFSINKGDLIHYQPYAMGRMKFLWGEDAEVFRPERWLNDAGDFEPESPFKFTAFQAGPRICLGKEFAYRQMKIFAATLLYFFKFKLWDEAKPVNYRCMSTLQIDVGLHVCAIGR